MTTTATNTATTSGTVTAVVHTTHADAAAAGRELGQAIREKFSDGQPDAVILFASSRYDYGQILSALQDACHPRALVGCSSAGEFTDHSQAEGSACAFAIRAPEMRFHATVGRGLRQDRSAAARQLVDGLSGLGVSPYQHRTALVLADALAGHTDDFVQELTRYTAGTYRFAGGGAGDDAQFRTTHVFFGTEAITDAAVALEILSNKPIGIGVRHGWQPASDPMRVTEATGSNLVSLNAIPTTEVFQEHATATGQRFDPAEPLPFFLQNVVGIEAPDGYKLRVPLGASEDGAVTFASDVPLGATARIMETSAKSAADAAASATEDAVRQLGTHKPAAALFFDCVATRLRTGTEFGTELEAVRLALGDAQYAGCNTYGQIARSDGQFSGFHNCTAVVCVLPE